ncbi:MAG: hypothetical protein ACHBN1_21790 [Heteroscytonema crispum UTEX LB 1556]
MRLRIFTVAALFAPFCLAASPKADASPSSQVLAVQQPILLAKESWTQLSPKQGGFTVLMPGKPIEEKETDKSDDTTTESYTYTVETKEGAFLLGYTEFPSDISADDPQGLLDAAAEGLTQDGGKLLRQRKISLSNNPGREVQYKNADGTTGTARIFVVKRRLYQLHAITPQTQDIKKFFDSFKFI